MIGLFRNKTTKNDLITYNGDFILDNICLKAIAQEELNGDYGIDCTFLINKSFGSEVYENLIEDALLKVDEEYGTEYFRICQVAKNKRDIQVYARHITISDILTMWCEDVRPTDLNGNSAINWIFDNAKGDNWFNVSSNISDKATAYYLNKNVYQALFDSDNSFLDRWGGEVERRGFNIKINAKIGTDRGVSIRSRKNLLGFEQSTNLNSLATRIYPKGFNGITIEEKYVDSPIIGNYGKIYTREVKFDDVRVNDEEYTEGFNTLKEAQDELKKRVNKMYKEDKVDVVSASYRVDFVQLEKTEEYKNYSIIEKTWLGDIVEVIEENLDVNILVRVTKRSFDVLRDMRTQTELSNKDLKIKPPSLGDIIDKIDKIPSQDDTLQKAKENATALINAGLKDSNVIVRKDEIIVGDTKDINTMVKVWRWNLNGLGYSNTGYYGEFGLAITNDGAIVADFIKTGVLNADIIKAGVIKGFEDNLIINLDNGEVRFKKGLIEGLNSSWNLRTGIFKTRVDYETYSNEVTIGNGVIDSNSFLVIRGKSGVNISSKTYKSAVAVGTNGINGEGSFLRGEEVLISAEGSFKKNLVLQGDVASQGGDFFIEGNLTVQGTINGVSNRIANLENSMLQSEGLI